MLGNEAGEVCFCSDWLPAFPRSDSAGSAEHFVLVATYSGHQLTFRLRWARSGRKQQLWLVAIRVPMDLKLYAFARTEVD